MKKIILLLFTCSLFAQESPRAIEKELQSAEMQFKRAKKMFNPWYTGPLITPSASMMPPGSANIQPYLLLNGAYATFDKHRESISLPHNLYSAQILSLLLVGVTPSVDCMLTTSATANWQEDHSGGGFNDLSLTAGFLIQPETLYVPAIKFTVTEVFPTGKYQHLNPNGLALSGTGQGSFQTQFGLVFSKLFWWIYSHPLNVRGFVGYNVETCVHVQGFNTYGGGSQTRGVVIPGNTFSSDFALEWSFSERWVLALDTVYSFQGKTEFRGFTQTPVGTGYSDNLSLCPAIEYNWDENLGVIAGVQFSVYGRNSQNFAKGQFSVSYVW